MLMLKLKDEVTTAVIVDYNHYYASVEWGAPSPQQYDDLKTEKVRPLSVLVDLFHHLSHSLSVLYFYFIFLFTFLSIFILLAC